MVRIPTLALLGMLVLGLPCAHAEQATRIIVPFSAGGSTDFDARIVAPYLADLTKRPIVVENKAGGSGVIGTAAAARAAPDGMTILMGTSTTMGTAPALLANLPYDVLRDFTPVGLVHTGDNVLVVHPSVAARDLQEFIAYAKANPGKLTYGSSGTGSTYHLGTELFAARAGIVLSHIPYKGAAPAAQDLVAGHIRVMIETLHDAAPYIRSGKVRALAIASPERNPEFPDIPTFAEQGLHGCEFSNWVGLFLPANAPATLVAELNADLNSALATPKVREKFAEMGMSATPGTPDQLGARLRSDIAKWTEVVRVARIKPE